jgi:hypothetical protein
VTTLAEAQAAYEASGALDWILLPDLAIPQTRWAMCDLKPGEWRFAAAYLRGLLEREPVKSSPHYAPVRMLLGTLAMELDVLTGIVGDEPAEAMRLYDRHDERVLSEFLDNAAARSANG